jgi:2-furoyl-CoA dehydrogenase FAD binding subunit
MKSAPFVMHQARTQSNILDLLDKYGEDARIIAGGQTLVPVLAMRVASPDHLIDINKVQELKNFGISGGVLQVGAGVRQSELENWSELHKTQPLLSMMFPWIAHTPIRNRGTVCGSIAHADPSAELVLALAVLDGSVLLASKKKRRIAKAKDFFMGALQTSRESNEFIEAVQFPIRGPLAGFGFAEYGYRHGDFAVVAVAVIKENDHWTIGFGGIDDVVKIFKYVANSLDEVNQFIDGLAAKIEVREDPTATSGLRRHLMRSLGLRACQQAIDFKSDEIR